MLVEELAEGEVPFWEEELLDLHLVIFPCSIHIAALETFENQVIPIHSDYSFGLHHFSKSFRADLATV